MRHLGTVCLGLLVALAGALPSRAQLAPIDPPFVITAAEGTPTSPRLAVRPDGTWLVVWTTAHGSRSLSGRFLGPGGSPLAPAFEIAPGPIESAAVALLPDGGFVAVWDQGHQIRGSLHDREGRVRVPAFGITTKFSAAPAVAVDAGGEWLVAWEEHGFGRDYDIGGRWYGPDGTPRTEPLRLSSAVKFTTQTYPGVAALPGGGFLAAWNEFNFAFPGNEEPLVARRFPAPGVPAGTEEFLLDGGVPSFLPLPDGQGLLAVSWPFGFPELVRLDAAGRPAGPAVRVDGQGFELIDAALLDAKGRLLLVGSDRDSDLLGRLYDPASFAPVGAPFEIPFGGPAPSEPVLAAAPSGQILMVWEEAGSLLGEIFAQGCAAADQGLCLGEGRFRVEVSWSNPQGQTWKAHPVPLRDDTGAFWFFTASNPELLIKILDGRSRNGHFWVFYGGLSNVAYEVRVVDTVTGASRLYTNPAGTLASQADTFAFPGEAAPTPSAAALSAPARPSGVPPLAAAGAAAGGCQSSDTALCLTSSYQVTVDFVDPRDGVSRPARTVPFSFEAGAFWFFGEENLELFVKVLDGTARNGHIWVFHGALTNVEYTITVRGPEGAEWTYHNPRGRMFSGADTAALPGLTGE